VLHNRNERAVSVAEYSALFHTYLATCGYSLVPAAADDDCSDVLRGVTGSAAAPRFADVATLPAAAAAEVMGRLRREATVSKEQRLQLAKFDLCVLLPRRDDATADQVEHVWARWLEAHGGHAHVVHGCELKSASVPGLLREEMLLAEDCVDSATGATARLDLVRRLLALLGVRADAPKHWTPSEWAAVAARLASAPEAGPSGGEAVGGGEPMLTQLGRVFQLRAGDPVDREGNAARAPNVLPLEARAVRAVHDVLVGYVGASFSRSVQRRQVAGVRTRVYSVSYDPGKTLAACWAATPPQLGTTAAAITFASVAQGAPAAAGADGL